MINQIEIDQKKNHFDSNVRGFFLISVSIVVVVVYKIVKVTKKERKFCLSVYLVGGGGGGQRRKKKVES